jgi:intracellular multiplication protein IcmV
MAKEASQTRRLLRTIFNPKVWMDLDQVKNSTNYITNGTKKLFTMKDKVTSSEGFEATMKRLGLDDKAIEKQKKSLFRLALLMLVMSLCVFSYAMILLYSGSLHSALATLIISLVILALAFRYHFWYYQLKVRRLGCGLKEWFVSGLLGADK